MAADQYQLNEPIVQALMARLQDPGQLNAEIAQIAAGCVRQDEAESLRPVAPEHVLDFVPPPSYLTDFPTIGIQDTSTIGEDDTGHSMTGRHLLGVVIFCSDPDQHILAWQLRRYLQAITRVCLAERTLGTDSPMAAWGTGFAGIDWGPTLASTSTPETWMSYALFKMWARREEL